MRILVAEDNPFYRRMLEATLSEWGYEVASTADGQAAWDVLQQKDAPRLAILDWMMPGMDGLELCRQIRAQRRSDPTYIILLTAKGGRDNIIAGLEGGADDYISKPFDREELHARLQVGLRIVGLQSSLAARVRELEGALSGAQKMEAVGRLAGGVAHDFNNLLTIIISGTEMLLMQKLDERQRELIDMIKQSGERGAALTRQLLAFSRRQVLAPVVLDMNGLIVNLEKMLRRLIGEDIELITDLAPAPAVVEADPGQLEQIIINLVVNSRDAMPQGGRLTIRTHSVLVNEANLVNHPLPRPGAYALLVVEDTGCGMTPETKARAFEPFFTTKEVGKGTGLGLATVYGIVQQSRGHIALDTTPGVGTTFRIYLPLAEKPVMLPEAAPRPVGSLAGTETVLLVEDGEPVRSMTRQILQSYQYNVLEAVDGPSALKAAQRCEGPIHLVLTDVVMPHLSGPQLAEQLMAQRPEIKVLYMSGYSDESMIGSRALDSSVPFLQKPFTPTALAVKVREVLNAGNPAELVTMM